MLVLLIPAGIRSRTWDRNCASSWLHNSGWVQSPSAKTLANPAEYARLRSYVTGIVGAFATDSRILAWECGTSRLTSTAPFFRGRSPWQDRSRIGALAPVFGWARAAGASQPLTSALWIPEDDWSRAADEADRADPDQSVGYRLIPQLQNPTEFQRHLAH